MRWGVVLVACWSTTVACYDPKLNGCKITCAPSGDQCPDGFGCGSDGKCFPLDGSCDGPQLGAVSQITAGGQHACAIDGDGALFCWGANDRGQLDGKPSAPVLKPTAVSMEGVMRWNAVDAGAQHTCAIGQDDSGSTGVYCWGDNTESQCGVDRDLEPQVALNKLAISDPQVIAAGNRHSCATTGANQLVCWGSNSRGQLGTPEQLGSALETPTEVDGQWRTVSIGSDTTCGVRDTNAVECWGRNDESQLGIGPSDMVAHAVPAPLQAFNPDLGLELSVGVDSACGINGGMLLCWGPNHVNGQAAQDPLVPTTNDVIETPTQAAGAAVAFSHVAMGHDFGCAIDGDGHVMCWGADDPRLGDNHPERRPAAYGPLTERPVVLGDGSDPGPAFAIAAGGARDLGEDGFACALFGDPSAGGTLRCWGANDHGQLGDDTRSAVGTATKITKSGPWAVVRVGNRTACAIGTNGATQCWGDNSRHQVVPDDDQIAFFADPVAVAEASTEADLAIGFEHVCALDAGAKKVHCWGTNSGSELGTDADVRHFDAINGATSYLTIHAGFLTTCAYAGPSLADCWGTGSWVGSASPMSFNSFIEGPPSVGQDTVCSITGSFAEVDCFGVESDVTGTRGDGDQFEPNPMTTTTVAINSAGTSLLQNVFVIADADSSAAHRCAGNTTTTFCWGQNRSGEIGKTPSVPVPMPPPVSKFAVPIDPAGENFVVRRSASALDRTLVVGAGFSCGIVDLGGQVHCWGANDLLQCSGNGRNDGVHAAIPSPTTFKSVAAGAATACGLGDDQEIYCWGASKHGETGTGIADRDYAADVQP